MITTRRTLMSWLLALLGVTCGLLRAEPQTKPEYDAAFVKTIVPERVTSHEVFPVAISVRNTGTRSWEGPSVRLRSISPRNNRVWGTDYILIAQGTAVKAGQEYAFRSHLKAVASKKSADVKTPQITALFARFPTRISAEAHPISTPNIRYRTYACTP